MAVNGELLVYPGQELTPQDFAIMMERISVIRSGILSGCTITFSETEENTLNVAEGYVFVRGRLVKVNAGTLDTSSLSSSVTTWYVYARLHLSEVEGGDLCTVYVTDTAASDATSEFNENDSGIAYATLATITVSGKQIKQVTTPEIGTVESFMLNSSGWSSTGDGLPIYTLSDPRFNSSVHLEIVPRIVGNDYAYLRVLQTANLQVYSIGEGTLVLASYGFQPTVNLELGMIFRGAL